MMRMTVQGNLWKALAYSLVMLFIAVATILCRNYYSEKQRQRDMYVIVQRIEYALHYYALEHGGFPNVNSGKLLAVLVPEGHLPGEMLNPYSREQLRGIELGAEPEAGDFSYVYLPPGIYGPREEDDDSFYVVGYSRRQGIREVEAANPISRRIAFWGDSTVTCVSYFQPPVPSLGELLDDPDYMRKHYRPFPQSPIPSP